MGLTKQDLTDIRQVVLDALEVAVEPRLDLLESGQKGLEGRMDGLEGRMDGLEGRMDGIQGRMDSIEGKMDGLEGRMSKLDVNQKELAQGQRETNRRLSDLEADLGGRLKALENDIKEIYLMLRQPTTAGVGGQKYQKLSDKKKLLILNEELLALANRAGITLPR